MTRVRTYGRRRHKVRWLYRQTRNEKHRSSCMVEDNTTATTKWHGDIDDSNMMFAGGADQPARATARSSTICSNPQASRGHLAVQLFRKGWKAAMGFHTEPSKQAGKQGFSPKIQISCPKQKAAPNVKIYFHFDASGTSTLPLSLSEALGFGFALLRKSGNPPKPCDFLHFL